MHITQIRVITDSFLSLISDVCALTQRQACYPSILARRQNIVQHQHLDFWVFMSSCAHVSRHVAFCPLCVHFCFCLSVAMDATSSPSRWGIVLFSGSITGLRLQADELWPSSCRLGRLLSPAHFLSAFRAQVPKWTRF